MPVPRPHSLPHILYLAHTQAHLRLHQVHAELAAQQHGPGHVADDTTRLSLRFKLELSGASWAVSEPATAGAMTVSRGVITVLAAEIVLKVMLMAFESLARSTQPGTCDEPFARCHVQPAVAPQSTQYPLH